jgi:hypothetical protein
MKIKAIKQLSGVRPVRNLLGADAGDYLKIRGEVVVIVQRLSERGRSGKVEWIARKSDGKSIVLTAKDSTDCERPTLVEALLVKTALLAHGLIVPVSKSLGTSETVAA